MLRQLSSPVPTSVLAEHLAAETHSEWASWSDEARKRAVGSQKRWLERQVKLCRDGGDRKVALLLSQHLVQTDPVMWGAEPGQED